MVRFDPEKMKFQLWKVCIQTTHRDGESGVYFCFYGVGYDSFCFHCTHDWITNIDTGENEAVKWPHPQVVHLSTTGLNCPEVQL